MISATALACYADGQLAGRPAITSHQVGAGSASYLSTRLDTAALDDYVFAINHSEAEAEVQLERPAHDLVTGTAFTGRLPAGEVAVLRME